jgi:hypothetical protein
LISHPFKTNNKTIVLVGGYGSGKSEIAMNLAIQTAREGTLSSPPVLIDLDVVKPMFRSREHAQEAIRLGVEVVAPEGELARFELPALNPRIMGVLKEKNRCIQVDVGGDDRGARALGSIRQFLADDHELLLVVNARRPFSADVDGMLQMANEVQEACHLKITGIVSNTHLIEWTNPDTILEGHQVALQAAERLQVPIRFLAARRDLAEQLSLDIPVLPLDLQFNLPWEGESAG